MVGQHAYQYLFIIIVICAGLFAIEPQFPWTRTLALCILVGSPLILLAYIDQKSKNLNKIYITSVIMVGIPLIIIVILKLLIHMVDGDIILNFVAISMGLILVCSSIFVFVLFIFNSIISFGLQNSNRNY